jgi:hypothetical protein
LPSGPLPSGPPRDRCSPPAASQAWGAAWSRARWSAAPRAGAAPLSILRSALTRSPLPARCSKPAPALTFAARRAAPVERRAAAPVQALGAAEIMQVADEAGFIAGVTGTMMAMVLVGLAMGFVLLRVESLVEEGKI